jgi:hypothetical protein
LKRLPIKNISLAVSLEEPLLVDGNGNHVPEADSVGMKVKTRLEIQIYILQ